MKWAVLPFALVALAPPQPAAAPPESPATIGDRLGWNARERTAAGRSALESGEKAQAVPAFDTALRLAPVDPVARFNAGTAHLEAKDPAAVALLEQAAKSAPAGLAPSAWYNLGNGRLAAGDAHGAVEAYIEALRRQPEHQNAKANLELALREIERQRQPPPESGKDQKKKPQQPQQSPGSGQKDEKEEPKDQKQQQEQQQQDQQQQPGKDQQPQQQQQQGQQQQAPSASGQSPLPQFHDLPDMTAEQAAAILRAVENLERQQRLDKAAKDAGARAQVEIDW